MKRANAFLYTALTKSGFLVPDLSPVHGARRPAPKTPRTVNSRTIKTPPASLTPKIRRTADLKPQNHA